MERTIRTIEKVNPVETLNNTEEKVLVKYAEYYYEDDIEESCESCKGIIYHDGMTCFLDYGYYICSSASYGLIRFDASLLSEIYELIESNNTEKTITSLIMSLGGKLIYYESAEHGVYIDEENGITFTEKGSEDLIQDDGTIQETDDYNDLPF